MWTTLENWGYSRYMAAYESVSSEAEVPFIPEDTFGLRLIALRTHLKLTQAEIAARCDLDDGSWSNWERGAKPRGMDQIVRKISDALGVDRDWLMWGGSLRTGSFSSHLSALADPTGQGTLLADDLSPLDFYSRADLTLV